PRARARRCGRYGAGRRELRGARGRASLIPVPPAWEDAARLAGTGRRSRTRAVVSPRRFRGTAVAASDRSDMAIEVGLTHRTSYAYDRPILLGPQVVRLRPAAHARTRILAYSFALEPAHHFLNWQQDPHGNWLGRIVIPEPTRRFEIVVDLVAEMAVVNPFDFFLEPGAESWPFRYEPLLRKDLLPYLEPEPAGPRLAAWPAAVDRSTARTVDFLVALNQRLQRDIGYVIRMEPGIQGCDETLACATGSCRDSAWLLVQILRHLGLAARFTSGYLIQ